jgi:hypothetical protein
VETVMSIRTGGRGNEDFGGKWLTEDDQILSDT